MHALLEKHGYQLLDHIDGSSREVACMAIHIVFIMEKISAGYALERIPDCLTVRASFINQYFNFRSRRHSGFTIKRGDIASAGNVD